MTPEQRQRLGELCRQIETESDQKKFAQLVYEVNVLFEEAQDSMGGSQQTDPASS